VSASAIADGLVTLLSAASVFGSANVTKDSYQVLESSACACAVVQWSGFSSGRMTHGGAGGDRRRVWSFQVRCFIRDTGQPEALLRRTWIATDKFVSAIESDPTIQDTADDLGDITGYHDPERVYSVGGATWAPITFTAQITEWTP
jgi:hypothetical protein